MSDLPKPAPAPCGSCPYRKDVPSGIWQRHEYEKLLRYDGETWEQPTSVFMCHQRDGNICSGWLACHGPQELLALRLPGNADPDAWDYTTNVPVFSSGREAHDHGVKDIDAPGERAKKMIHGLIRRGLV